MEQDFLIPGDEQYEINQPLEPTGISPLLPPEDRPGLPNIGTIAKNVAKNKVLDYVAGKIGLNAAQATGIISILGMGVNPFAPLAAASALTGRSLGVSDYLSNKRAQKAIQRNIANDQQGNITTTPTGIMAIQPTNQDKARGGKTTRSTPESTYSAPQQTSGPGGLHSDY